MPNELMTEENNAELGPIVRGLALVALLCAAASAWPQSASSDVVVVGAGTVLENSTEVAEEYLALSAADLADLVAPVALYPDDLLAIVLPAATYPLEIVLAARFLNAVAEDGALTPDENWDESVVALLNYPEVVTLLSDDLDWTWQLGQAVLIQQADVLAAVMEFRRQAYAAGNLVSDEYQVVKVTADGIEIHTIDPEVIYVPYYEPTQVLTYQSTPVYHYYERPYPVYYYPYPVDHHFYSGFFWGVTSAFSIGWNTHHLHLHHLDYFDHPYYGHDYYHHYYRRPLITFNYSYFSSHSYRHHEANYWRPAHHRVGARPGRNHRRYSDRGDYRHSDYRNDSSRDGVGSPTGGRQGGSPQRQSVAAATQELAVATSAPQTSQNTLRSRTDGTQRTKRDQRSQRPRQARQAQRTQNLQPARQGAQQRQTVSAQQPRSVGRTQQRQTARAQQPRQAQQRTQQRRTVRAEQPRPVQQRTLQRQSVRAQPQRPTQQRTQQRQTVKAQQPRQAPRAQRTQQPRQAQRTQRSSQAQSAPRTQRAPQKAARAPQRQQTVSRSQQRAPKAVQTAPRQRSSVRPASSNRQASRTASRQNNRGNNDHGSRRKSLR